MNYSNIKFYDIANGVGVRTTLFVSGCRNHCPGCFQPETWDFNYGKKFTWETIDLIIDSCKEDYIDGITILGGEPFEEENQEPIYHLLAKFRATCPNKTVWIFTGYLLQDLIGDEAKKETPVTFHILRMTDVLVDGPFMLEKKNLCLKFRGSENQRIIDLRRSFDEGKLFLLD